MTPNPGLDIERLLVGQPDLDDSDQTAAARGIAIGFILSAPFWIGLGFAVARWWLA